MHKFVALTGTFIAYPDKSGVGRATGYALNSHQHQYALTILPNFVVVSYICSWSCQFCQMVEIYRARMDKWIRTA